MNMATVLLVGYIGGIIVGVLFTWGALAPEINRRQAIIDASKSTDKIGI